MALVDYNRCFVCGTKVFYDADLMDRNDYEEAYISGRIACLCEECSGNYELTVETKCEFPWFTFEDDKEALQEFINNLEWTHFVKGGLDRVNNRLVFLKNGKITVGAIKSKSNKRHTTILEILRGEN